MPKELSSTIIRNTGHLLQLGGLAALSMFTGKVFRTAAENYARTLVIDYQNIRQIVREARS